MSRPGIALALSLATCDGKKARNVGALSKAELGSKSGPKLLFLLVTGMNSALLHEPPVQLRSSLNSRNDQPLVVFENWLVRICPTPSALSPKLPIEITGDVSPWPMK